MKNLLLLPILLFATRLAAIPAPDFTITTSDGQVRKLYQDYVNQGKVVVIEAFFTTCPPCATHAPFFQSLYVSAKAAHPDKVEFILLSTLQTDNNAKAAAYLTAKMMTMLAAAKDGGSLTALQPYMGGQFGSFSGTPTFWVIAPGTGEVTFDIRGNTPQQTMSLIGQKIDALLPATPTQCFLKSPNDLPVSDVKLAIHAAQFDTTITASGTYSLSNIQKLKNTTYTVTPSKKSEPLEGLTTYDLVLTSKHILGLDTFTQPWQLAAADFNCTGTVTTFDIVLGRRLILGIDTAFLCSSWHFLQEPPGSPINGGCLNFRCVKVGDLNGQYFSGAPEDRSPLELVLPDISLQAGETRRISLTIQEAMTLTGLQLSLGFDPQVLHIEEVTSPVLSHFDATSRNLNVQSEGRLPIAWVNAAGDALSADMPVLSLQVTALKTGRLSDMLRIENRGMRTEAVQSDNVLRQIALRWESPDHVITKPFSLVPNPARDACFVLFEADHDADRLVQLLDLQGKVVFEKTVVTQRGPNRIELRPTESLSGLIVVKMDGAAIGKVLFASGK